MYNHLCTACGSERPRSDLVKGAAMLGSWFVGQPQWPVLHTLTGSRYQRLSLHTILILATFLLSAARPRSLLSCVAKRSAITSASPGSTVPLALCYTILASTCIPTILMFALHRRSQAVHAKTALGFVWCAILCRPEMILRGTVIQCVDGDLDIVCCAVDEGDASIWYQFGVQKPQHSGRYPVQNRCIRASL